MFVPFLSFYDSLTMHGERGVWYKTRWLYMINEIDNMTLASTQVIV